MTKLMEKAFEEASKLPELEQNVLAKRLLDELTAERNGSQSSRYEQRKKRTKRSAAEKERSFQAALVCGEAFQRLAEEFIPRIRTIKEKPSQAMSSELGDLSRNA